MPILLALALALLFPSIALAVDGVAPIPPEQLGELAMHAGAIALVLRGAVAFLRSPFGGLLWLRVPPRGRPLVLLLLGGLAAALESLAAGRPWPEALFIALGGVGGAVTTHEIQSRVLSPKAVATPPQRPVLEVKR